MSPEGALGAFANASTASTMAALALVALLSYAVAEGWRRWALRRGVMDVPGHRSSHAVATPRGAGIGIVVAVVAGSFVLVPASVARDATLLSLVLMAALGLWDDLRPLSPALKLAGQALAAIPVAMALPLPVSTVVMDVPLLASAVDGTQGLPGVVEHAGTLALVLLFVNAWNFMDGIDGLAAAAAMAVGACAWMAVGAGGAAAGWPLLGAVLLAACGGFLPVNLSRAKAFMGDCGSHALGVAVAAVVLGGPPGGPSWVAAAGSSAFIVDVLGTLALRFRDGERLSTAHRRHLYQLVIRCGYSHGRVTTAYAAWMLACGGSVAAAQSAGAEGPVAIVVVAVTAALWAGLVRHFGARVVQREARP